MRRTSAASALALLPLAALVATLAWRSRAWPLVHDAPLMHYIAWRISEGAVPYRDLFDMNFPGVYLIHLGVLYVFGASDAGWRLFDLVWLVGTGLCVAALVWPWGRVAAAGAALFFATYHLAGGAWQAGQRDFLLGPFLLLGALGVARWAETGAEITLLWGGLSLGAALSVKPHAALLVAGLLVLVAVVARRRGRAPWTPLATLAMAALLVPMLVTVWVAALGALDAWREIVFEYLVPLYARLGRSARWTIWRWEAWVPIGVGVVATLVSARVHRRLGARHAVAVIGLGYGLAHFVVQGKGWEYHLYPLAAFAATLLFAEVDPFLGTRRWAPAAVALTSIVGATALLGIKGVEASHASWIADTQQRVSAVVHDLDGRVGRGERVQVLDTTQGGIDALLRLRVVQPTRFVYDFHFYHDTDTAIVHRLRAEFAEEFDRHPPVFVVLFERGWPSGGYERVERFGSLRLRLTGYRLERSGPGYRVYAR